jgi:hypothetical protein
VGLSTLPLIHRRSARPAGSSETNLRRHSYLITKSATYIEKSV